MSRSDPYQPRARELCLQSGIHTLRPFAVAMAGEGEFDPFKD